MSQDASRSQTLHSPTKTSSQNSSWGDGFGTGVVTESGGFSAESYADRLMDELFGEVEQALDMHTRLPDTPLEPESTPAPTPTVSPSEFVLPLARSQKPELALEDEVAIAQADPIKLATPVKNARPSGRSYDRLLIGVGCVSVVATLAIWFITQEAKQPAPKSAGSTQIAANSKAASNSQFSNYVNQALQAIEQKSQPPGTVSTIKPGVPTSTLPTVSLPATQAPAPARPARPSTGLGRLLVPVSPLPTVALPNQTASAPLPKIAATNRTAAPQAAQPESTVQRKVVGLMERTDRFPAVALVEIDGVVQRFQVGESVGSSGWNLVEVSKNQAIIRRNGEVRSIFIGQTF